jgi:Fe-S-cluster containining protein
VLRSCSIYDERPDICRVDLQYIRRFSQHYSWTQFVELNSTVCEALQDEANRSLIYRGNS